MPTFRRDPRRVLGWVLGFHSMLGPAMEGQLGRNLHQAREWRKKARCPLSSSKQGYMGHLCLSFMMPVLGSWLELGGILPFGQAQSQKDRGKQEDVWVRNIPACPTVCSESSVMTWTRFPSDNPTGEMLLALEALAQVSWYVNPTT